VVGNGTRLVFEIQSIATGQYVSGLTAELEVHAPNGTQRLLPLPEVTGVTAYYETTLVFEQEGEYTLTWRSGAAGVPFSTTFRKAVSRSTLHGDWPTLLGYGTVLADCTRRLSRDLDWPGVVCATPLCGGVERTSLTL
jgi:hypothetical protein